MYYKGQSLHCMRYGEHGVLYSVIWSSVFNLVCENARRDRCRWNDTSRPEHHFLSVGKSSNSLILVGRVPIIGLGIKSHTVRYILAVEVEKGIYTSSVCSGIGAAILTFWPFVLKTSLEFQVLQLIMKENQMKGEKSTVAQSSARDTSAGSVTLIWKDILLCCVRETSNHWLSILLRCIAPQTPLSMLQNDGCKICALNRPCRPRPEPTWTPPIGP